MSSAEIEIVEMAEIPTIEVNVKVTMPGIPRAIGSTYHRLAGYLEKKAEKMGGEPYVRYLDIDWDKMMHENRLLGFLKMFTRKWNMLVGFPMQHAVKGEGAIRPGAIPGGRYLVTLHTGPYQNMGETYNKLYAYAQANGLRLRGECIEKYLNGPDTVSKEELQTVVMIPLEA